MLDKVASSVISLRLLLSLKIFFVETNLFLVVDSAIWFFIIGRRRNLVFTHLIHLRSALDLSSMSEFFQGFSGVFKLPRTCRLSLHNFRFNSWLLSTFARNIQFLFPILKLFDFHGKPFNLFLNIRSGLGRYVLLMRMFGRLKQFVRLLMSFRISVIRSRLFSHWIFGFSIVLGFFAFASQLLLSLFEFGLSVFEALFNLFDFIVVFKF